MFVIDCSKLQLKQIKDRAKTKSLMPIDYLPSEASRFVDSVFDGLISILQIF